MWQSIRGNCVIGALLAIMAGCALPDKFGLSFLQTTDAGGDRLVAGSLENVSETTQAGLKRLGIKVVQTSQAQDVRLAATTPAGDHFAVVLTQVKTEEGERVRVRLEGASSSHQEMVVKIISDKEEPASH